jgi:uncharacterized protein YjiS (DUF1127 family)
VTTLIMAADTIGLTGLASWFKKVNAKLAYRAQVRQTIKDLSRLTDYELNDIGIARGDIRNIAYGDSTLKRSVNDNLKGWV